MIEDAKPVLDAQSAQDLLERKFDKDFWFKFKKKYKTKYNFLNTKCCTCKKKTSSLKMFVGADGRVYCNVCIVKSKQPSMHSLCVLNAMERK